MEGVPRDSRRSGRLTIETHRAVEAGAGLALFLLPFLLRYISGSVDFSTGAIVTFGVLGVAAATLGFAGTRAGRDASGGSHVSFDRVICGAAVLAVFVFAVQGEIEAVLFAGAFAIVYGVLIAFTRYSSGD